MKIIVPLTSVQANPANPRALKTYSFRAECIADVEEFRSLLAGPHGVISEVTTTGDDGYPDVRVEMRSEASLDQLRSLIRQVVDGHVMLQTLRELTLADNNLERDYSLR